MDQAKNDTPPSEDIPEARRETVTILTQPAAAPNLGRWLGLGIAAIALLGGGFVLLGPLGQGLLPGRFRPMRGIADAPPAAAPATELNPASTATATPDGASPSTAERLVPSQKTLLGHRAYEDAPAETLVALTADGRIRLRQTAADRFQAMAAAAASEGIYLVPLSGFRSQADQAHIFFDVKADRGESPSDRAEVSAPPGYSEHHTGYALDIGDGDNPETDVEFSFAETAAYRWLQANAARYGFELSFPENNPQGVAFEPWHWRFVGDRDSLETFYQE